MARGGRVTPGILRTNHGDRDGRDGTAGEARADRGDRVQGSVATQEAAASRGMAA